MYSIYVGFKQVNYECLKLVLFKSDCTVGLLLFQSLQRNLLVVSRFGQKRLPYKCPQRLCLFVVFMSGLQVE